MVVLLDIAGGLGCFSLLESRPSVAALWLMDFLHLLVAEEVIANTGWKPHGPLGMVNVTATRHSQDSPHHALLEAKQKLKDNRKFHQKGLKQREFKKNEMLTHIFYAGR